MTTTITFDIHTATAIITPLGAEHIDQTEGLEFARHAPKLDRTYKGIDMYNADELMAHCCGSEAAGASPFAFILNVDGEDRIYVNTVFFSMTEDMQNAFLAHEYGHILNGHGNIFADVESLIALRPDLANNEKLLTGNYTIVFHEAELQADMEAVKEGYGEALLSYLELCSQAIRAAYEAGAEDLKDSVWHMEDRVAHLKEALCDVA